MAIKPTELGHLTEAEKLKVAELEQEIDNYLSTQAQTTSTLTGFQYRLGGKLENNAVRNELTRRYKEVGWSYVKIIESSGVSVLILQP